MQMQTAAFERSNSQTVKLLKAIADKKKKQNKKRKMNNDEDDNDNDDSSVSDSD